MTNHNTMVGRIWLKNGLSGGSILSSKNTFLTFFFFTLHRERTTGDCYLPTKDCKRFHPANKTGGVVKNNAKRNKQILINPVRNHQYFGSADKFSQMMLLGDGARSTVHFLDLIAVETELAL